MISALCFCLYDCSWCFENRSFFRDSHFPIIYWLIPILIGLELVLQAIDYLLNQSLFIKVIHVKPILNFLIGYIAPVW